MSAPQKPQQQQQARVRSYEVRTRVNHPIGAPQFAAISSIVDSSASNSKDAISADVPLCNSSTSIITALPHARGIFNGVMHDQTTNSVGRVQCFSAWQSPEHYKSMMALTAATGAGGDIKSSGGSSSSGDSSSSSDDDDVGADKRGGDGDSDDGGAGDNDEEPEEDTAAAGKKPGGKKRKFANANNSKKKHQAWRARPERRPEAWFVMSPIVAEQETESAGGATVGYELFPLLEVFACQRRAAQHLDKGQQREHVSDAPRLFHVAGLRRQRKQ